MELHRCKKPSSSTVTFEDRMKFVLGTHRAMWRTALVASCLCLALAGGGNALAEDPWADEVTAYHAIDPNPGFDTPGKTLGEPVGGGTSTPDNSSLHSVGRPGPAPGSYVILRFDTPVTDDADNPMGLDCIVFSNAYWTGGNPQRKWVEPGLIEISEDVNGNGQADDAWYVLGGSRSLDRSVLPEGIANPTPPLAGNVLNPNGDDVEYDWGYAELTPTQRKYLDNYVRPDDPYEVGLTPRSGGGDAFDIASAVPVDAGGNPEGVTQFHFIRVSAFVNMQNPAFGFITPEIDAAADVAPDVDNDGDGILDEYETRVAGTDPARSESTVLALEIPPEDGGSPAGAELGTAHDADGNAIALYSSGLRIGSRNYNCIVDILKPADPGGSIPGLIKSGAVREFQSTEADFQAAQIQDAEVAIAYMAPEIAGLDEPGLQPFRYAGGAYTEDGIYGIMKDTESNLLTFRTQYPGIFVLASTAGEGDIDSPPAGVVLHAAPPHGVAGDPGSEAAITSEPILLPDESPAPEGMPFTVLTTLGVITTFDEAPGTPGVQVLVSGGMIAFALQASTHAGTATVTAISLDGLTYGQLLYDFLAGPPAGPIDIFLADPNATAPGPVAIMAGPVTDAYGNPLDEDAYLTLVTIGGTPATADADPSQPGHQVALNSGVAGFYVAVGPAKDDDTESVTVVLYGDAALTQLLGEQTFNLEVVEMPLNGLLPLCIMIALAALAALRSRPLRRE